MLTAALILLAAFLIGGGWLALEFLRAPLIPASTFDDHAATACALLQPDHPHLPDEGTPFADEVEGWLSSRTPTIRPAFPEES